MFGKPILTQRQADNRARHFWCDLPGCKTLMTASNKDRHKKIHEAKKHKGSFDPKDRDIIQKQI